MSQLTPEERDKELRRIAAIPDEAIDTSDIPELTEEQLRRAVRGRWFSPKLPDTRKDK